MRKAKKNKTVKTKKRQHAAGLPEGVEPLMTVENCADASQSHPQSVRAWMRKGVLPYVQLPGSRRKWVKPSDWRKMIEDHRHV